MLLTLFQDGISQKFTRFIIFIGWRNLAKKSRLRQVITYLEASSISAARSGSPDKAGGEIPQTKRKVIYLHHEHTRTFSIGAVDSAIRDTFKL